MKKAYLLIGAPGSGKSTWAQKQMAKMPDAVYLSTDKYIDDAAAAHGLTYNEAFDTYKNAATEHMRSETVRAIEQSKDIIWDQTNMSAKSRRSKISCLKSARYDVTAVVFIVDRNELNRRLAHRSHSTGKYISDRVVEQMLGNYTEPTLAEGFCEIIFVPREVSK